MTFAGFCTTREQLETHVRRYEQRETDAIMLSSLDQFKNLMVWFACEKVAQEYENAGR
jgi:hypothetical protein